MSDRKLLAASSSLISDRSSPGKWTFFTLDDNAADLCPRHKPPAPPPPADQTHGDGPGDRSDLSVALAAGADSALWSAAGAGASERRRRSFPAGIAAGAAAAHDLAVHHPGHPVSAARLDASGDRACRSATRRPCVRLS